MTTENKICPVLFAPALAQLDGYPRGFAEKYPSSLPGAVCIGKACAWWDKCNPKEE